MQSSVHGGLGTNLIDRFLLRNSASRHRRRHGGHVKKERSGASDRRDVQPIQGGLSMSLHGLSMASPSGTTGFRA